MRPVGAAPSRSRPEQARRRARLSHRGTSQISSVLAPRADSAGQGCQDLARVLTVVDAVSHKRFENAHKCELGFVVVYILLLPCERKNYLSQTPSRLCLYHAGPDRC